MPRRPTEHCDCVPLWLLPQMLLDWIRRVGEELEWVQIRRKLKHYVIDVRTRPVNRRIRHQRVVPVPEEAL